MALNDEIIGNKKICKMLEKSFASGRYSHAYLFEGPEHIGKKTLALKFCKFLLSGAFENVEKNPDLTIVAPKEDKKQIMIGQIRELEKNLCFSPYQSKYKIAIIEQAEKMTEEASNALLKTLEEPSEATILILLVSDSRRILETVKSRCQVFKFLPVKKNELVSHFCKEVTNEKELEEIMELSGYKPGKIIELISDRDHKKELSGELEFIRGVSKKSDIDKMEKAEAISGCEERKIVEVLDVWALYFRQLMLSRHNGQRDIEYARIETVLRKIGLIKKTKEDVLTKNINLKLALENLLLEM